MKAQDWDLFVPQQQKSFCVKCTPGSTCKHTHTRANMNVQCLLYDHLICCCLLLNSGTKLSTVCERGKRSGWQQLQQTNTDHGGDRRRMKDGKVLKEGVGTRQKQKAENKMR